MPDIFLRQGAANPNDIILRDPRFQELKITLTATFDDAVISSAIEARVAVSAAVTTEDAALHSTITVVNVAGISLTLTKTLDDATLSCKVKHLGKLVGGVGSSFHLVPEVVKPKLPVRWLWVYATLDDAMLQSHIATVISAKSIVRLDDAKVRSFVEVEDDDLQLIEDVSTWLLMEDAA